MTNKLNFLWLLPFSEFDSDINSEIGLINGINSFGHTNTVIRCGGYLKEYCTPMNANRLKEDSLKITKSLICKSCKWKGEQSNKILKARTLHQVDYITKNDLVNVKKIINTMDFGNWKKFEFKKIPLGRFAAYEILLNNKIKEEELNQGENLNKYKISLKNSMLTAISVEKILQRDDFDVMFVRNSLYSVNRVASWIASKKNIKVYSFQNEAVLRDTGKRLYIYKWDYHPSQLASSPEFLAILENNQNKYLKLDQMKEFVENTQKDLSLQSYSEPLKNMKSGEIRKNLGIKNKNKNILISMSSGDENIAAEVAGLIPSRGENALFENQNAWVNFLIDIAKEVPEINFIFRIHPREISNRRDAVLSSNYKSLLKIFNSLPNNVFVNYPHQKISIHDIFSITDLSINFGSSTGLDAMCLGIPVLSQDEDFCLGYPIKLGYVIHSKSEYLKMINTLINKKIDTEVQIKASLWIEFLRNQATFIIEDNKNRTKQDYVTRIIKNVIFKFGRGIVVINSINKLIKILTMSNAITDTNVFKKNVQFQQIFEMIQNNETHYIKKLYKRDLNS
jgi:hypothetical protein